MNKTFYNLERINAEADLLAIIGRDTTLTRKGHSPNGVEYAGACPICGQAEHDGFVVQPERSPRPAWFCRRHTGPAALSAIDYVAQRDGLDPHKRGDLEQIVHTLAGTAAPVMTGPAPQKATPIRDLKLPPAQAWQTAAAAYIQYAEAQLWSPAGTQALAYLHGRGLTDETIKAFRFGYNPTGMNRPAEKWGTPNDNPEPLYLRPGIVIPWITGEEIWAINTRSMTATDPRERYKKVRGSRGAIYNADALERADVALFLEGELDAALAQQEAGSSLAAASLGSGSGLPDFALWAFQLYRPNVTLFLPDNDEAGWETLGKFADANLVRFLVPVTLPDQSKDLGDYYRAGGDVAGWLREQLEAYAPEYAYVTSLAAELGLAVTIREQLQETNP